MLLEGGDEMVGVLLALKFNAKIIDYKSKRDGTRDVSPKAGGVGHFIVPRWRKSLFQELVCQSPRLGKSVNCLSDFYVNEAALLLPLQVVLLNNVGGKTSIGNRMYSYRSRGADR